MIRLIVLFLGSVVVMFAQAGPQFSGEEIRLVELFRANPAPYRALMYGAQPVDGPPNSAAPSFGKTDVVEIGIAGGKLSFVGRNGRTKHGSIRIIRGATAVVALARDDDPASAAVTVSFTNEGLKLEWPAVTPAKGAKGLAAGTLTIPETEEWKKGDVVKWSGAIDNSSETEELRFRVRYYAR